MSPNYWYPFLHTLQEHVSCDTGGACDVGRAVSSNSSSIQTTPPPILCPQRPADFVTSPRPGRVRRRVGATTAKTILSPLLTAPLCPSSARANECNNSSPQPHAQSHILSPSKSLSASSPRRSITLPQSQPPRPCAAHPPPTSDNRCVHRGRTRRREKNVAISKIKRSHPPQNCHIGFVRNQDVQQEQTCDTGGACDAGHVVGAQHIWEIP